MWLPSCYLIRADNTARPAFLWMVQYVKNNPLSVPETVIGVPSTYALEQNFPNPFNPTTSIRYRIPATSKVSLQLFDILGREVQTLVNTIQSSGTYTVTLNARNLASGVYFYRFNAGGFSSTKKLVMVK